MARSYAKLYVSIWAGDFRGLSRAGQHLYLLLNSSPKLTPAGLVPIQVRKWSAQSADATIGEVQAAFAELVAKRYVLADEDTEEALIRTFIRHDQGYRNKFLRKSIESAIPLIESASLREHARLELAACMEDLLASPQVEDSEQDPYEESSEDACQEAYEANYTFNLQPSTSPSSSNVAEPHDGSSPVPPQSIDDEDGIINRIITRCASIRADKARPAAPGPYHDAVVTDMQANERGAIAALLVAKPYMRAQHDKAAAWYEQSRTQARRTGGAA